MTRGGGGVRQKVILYDKEGRGWKKVFFFYLGRMANLLGFFHFKSYCEPKISLFSWSSNKSERGIGKS